MSTAVIILLIIIAILVLGPLVFWGFVIDKTSHAFGDLKKDAAHCCCSPNGDFMAGKCGPLSKGTTVNKPCSNKICSPYVSHAKLSG